MSSNEAKRSLMTCTHISVLHYGIMSSNEVWWPVHASACFLML